MDLKRVSRDTVAKYENEITWKGKTRPIQKSDSHTIKLGQYAIIRSCRDGEGDELLVGVFIGDVMGLSPFGGIPAFHIFKLNDIRLGLETWWSPVPDEDLIRGCDAIKERHGFDWNDIENQVNSYLKMFNDMAEEKEKEKKS